MFTIVWDETRRLPADQLPAGTQQWQGVRDPNVFLWWLEDGDALAATAEKAGIARGRVRVLQTLREWDTPARRGARLANFVLREMTPASVETFVPLLFEHTEKVIASPGCLGDTLAAERGIPHHLLGITYWESAAAFGDYMGWASQHSWKGVVDPVTVDVPLRLFVKRID
ncbi:MAG TPA: antibiotic biosynthesis monooxygenase [Phototrophicaceae bacterium]|nr:antibiotic biosynthesis monooxygenase [Phototrophicaceae bacterium]